MEDNVKGKRQSYDLFSNIQNFSLYTATPYFVFFFFYLVNMKTFRFKKKI